MLEYIWIFNIMSSPRMSAFKWKSGSYLTLKDIFHTVVSRFQHKTHSSFFGIWGAWETFMGVIGDLEENRRHLHYPAAPGGPDPVVCWWMQPLQKYSSLGRADKQGKILLATWRGGCVGKPNPFSLQSDCFNQEAPWHFPALSDYWAVRRNTYFLYFVVR